MKLRKIIFLLLILILAVSIGACSIKTGGHTDTKAAAGDGDKNLSIEAIGEGYPLTIKDFTGYETVLDKKPENAAILSGTSLNIWYDLGGKSICTSNISKNIKLVAEHKDEIMSIPSVGATYSVDMEKVIEHKPDLIIAQEGTQGEQAKKLRDMGFKVVVARIKSYDDVMAAYRAFGKMLDSEEVAEKRISEIENKKQELVSKLPEKKTSVVILYVTSKALAVKLDNSIAGDVSNILGLKNIASDLPPDTIGSETTPLDIEYIVEKNPDYVLVTSMISSNETAKKTMEEQFAASPAWRGVKAVSEGRVIYLPQEYFLFNSGPYYGEAIEYVARSIYPEVYGEVKGWYEK